MDSRRIKQTRIVKLPGLPEIVRRGNGSARVIDATVKPAPRVSRNRPPPPEVPVVTATVSRSSTPNLAYPDRDLFEGRQSRRRATSASPAPVAPSPYTEPILMENFKRLDEQLHVIHEQLESVLKIFNEQQLSSVSSTHSQYLYSQPPQHSPSPQPVVPDISPRYKYRTQTQPPVTRTSPPVKHRSHYQHFMEQHLHPSSHPLHSHSQVSQPHGHSQQHHLYSQTHSHSQTRHQYSQPPQPPIHTHLQPQASPPLSPSPSPKFTQRSKPSTKHSSRYQPPEPLADVSFASRDYLRRNNIID